MRAWTSAFSDGISPWAGPDGETTAGAALGELRDHLQPILADRDAHPRPDLLSALATNPDPRRRRGPAAGGAAVHRGPGHHRRPARQRRGGGRGRSRAVGPAGGGPDPMGTEHRRGDAALGEPGSVRDAPPRRPDRALGDDAPRAALLCCWRWAPPTATSGSSPSPDRFEPSRIERGERRHLAFGSGVHRCLGAPLARLQGAIVLRALAERHPRLRLAAPVRARPRLFLRGPEAVTVDRWAEQLPVRPVASPAVRNVGQNGSQAVTAGSATPTSGSSVAACSPANPTMSAISRRHATLNRSALVCTSARRSRCSTISV